MKLFGDFLRDVTLDNKYLFRIAIILLCPYVRVGARRDQLRVYMEQGSGFAHAALQHMRHVKGVADLAHISLAAIFHDTGAADHLEIGNFCQLGQDIVLEPIGKERVPPIAAEIFEW